MVVDLGQRARAYSVSAYPARVCVSIFQSFADIESAGERVFAAAAARPQREAKPAASAGAFGDGRASASGPSFCASAQWRRDATGCDCPRLDSSAEFTFSG